MFNRRISFDLDDEPMGDAWSKWGLGVVVPSLIATYGLSRVILRHAVLYGRRGASMPLTGWDAIVFGIAVLGAALFMHAHYFWSNSNRLAEYAELGKVIGLLVGLSGIGFVVVRNFTLI